MWSRGAAFLCWDDGADPPSCTCGNGMWYEGARLAVNTGLRMACGAIDRPGHYLLLISSRRSLASFGSSSSRTFCCFKAKAWSPILRYALPRP